MPLALVVSPAAYATLFLLGGRLSSASPPYPVSCPRESPVALPHLQTWERHDRPLFRAGPRSTTPDHQPALRRSSPCAATDTTGGASPTTRSRHVARTGEGTGGRP